MQVPGESCSFGMKIYFNLKLMGSKFSVKVMSQLYNILT